MQTNKSPRNAIVINGVTYKAVLVNTMGMFAPYDLCALCDLRRRCKPDEHNLQPCELFNKRGRLAHFRKV